MLDPATQPPPEEGAFVAGEPVTIIDSKCRRSLIFARPDVRIDLGAGSIMANELIGALPGVRLRTSRGQVVAAYRTTLEEYILLMPRAAQVIPPKDIGFIVMWADVAPGHTVVEAGIGSGALTMALLRAVGERGKVISFELRDDHRNRALKNIAAWPDRLEARLDARSGDVVSELCELTSVDRVILDVPEPHLALESAALALKPGGFVLVYTPNIRQIDTFVMAVLDHTGFAEPEVAEVIVRPWVADRQRLRPELRITGHSGFIARARRRGGRAASMPEVVMAAAASSDAAGDDSAADAE
jgi:tRNA (adenine57-N1/adenine58-N1)-methyltransferase catalytic subunit